MSESVDAVNLVNGERQSKYGSPWVNFRRIAFTWMGIFDNFVTPTQVALASIGIKLGRAAHSPEFEDHRVDTHGYANTWEQCEARLAQLKADYRSGVLMAGAPAAFMDPMDAIVVGEILRREGEMVVAQRLEHPVEGATYRIFVPEVGLVGLHVHEGEVHLSTQIGVPGIVNVPFDGKVDEPVPAPEVRPQIDTEGVHIHDAVEPHPYRFKVGDRVVQDTFVRGATAYTNRFLGMEGMVVKVDESDCALPYLVVFGQDRDGNDTSEETVWTYGGTLAPAPPRETTPDPNDYDGDGPLILAANLKFDALELEGGDDFREAYVREQVRLAKLRTSRGDQ